MGTDKSKLNYHEKNQSEYLFDELSFVIAPNNICYSVRDKKQLEKQAIVVDQFAGFGLFGAILSAFMQNKNTTWLTVATDLPFVDKTLLKLLVSKRSFVFKKTILS